MMILKYGLVVLVVLWSSVSYTSGNAIVVLLDIRGGKEVISIDNVQTKKERMYDQLAKALSSKGREAQVSVLFNPVLPFSEVVNVCGLLQAVGFSDIRFYYLSDDKQKMAEVELSKPATIVPDGLVKRR